MTEKLQALNLDIFLYGSDSLIGLGASQLQVKMKQLLVCFTLHSLEIVCIVY